MNLYGRTILTVISLGVAGWGAVGCQPRTPAQKVEDKVEDAGHEISQGVERAKENVKDATR